jgi:hypothetical protein
MRLRTFWAWLLICTNDLVETEENNLVSFGWINANTGEHAVTERQAIIDRSKEKLTDVEDTRSSSSTVPCQIASVHTKTRSSHLESIALFAALVRLVPLVEIGALSTLFATHFQLRYSYPWIADMIPSPLSPDS